MAPVGTHTGWNLRRKGFGIGEQCAGGSFIPFATTAAERYPSDDAYVRAVATAANALVEGRLLLAQDAADIVELARFSGPSAQD